MKRNVKKMAAAITAIAAVATLSGCAAAGGAGADNIDIIDEAVGGLDGEFADESELRVPEQLEDPQEPAEPQPEVTTPKPVVQPTVKTVSYLKVTTDSVNLRAGAGTSYSVRGTAEKSTMYALDGEANGWYKTGYKNKTAYISSKYCVLVAMTESGNEKIESIIAAGTGLLGAPYVYGAARLHDGKGNINKNFTVNEFDCSSLMQYIFYKGAGKLLDVNTRTQIYQGNTVKRSELKRGDLMFFTNASRKNNNGVERVGHVALYLGDNWILHTASDYAKIEQISSTRWSYFIQGQRII